MRRAPMSIRGYVASDRPNISCSFRRGQSVKLAMDRQSIPYLTYRQVIKFMFIRAKDRVVKVISVADNAHRFVGVVGNIE